jgi:tRNA threonylcarbamoyl adenosine modification protein (Sua5/YciO/YrdC/YwlC family)
VDIDEVVASTIDAIRRGAPVLLSTDTVYGLCASAADEAAAERVYGVKRREGAQPTALIAADVDTLFAILPELDERATEIVRTLLPGPYTLVLPNPARRFPWLTGAHPATIGVRVAVLPEPTQRVLDAVGCVLATSANAPGGVSPATLADVPDWIRAACEAEIDVGRLPGVASTVLDFTGPEPVVLREGTAPSSAAIERVGSNRWP